MTANNIHHLNENGKTLKIKCHNHSFFNRFGVFFCIFSVRVKNWHSVRKQMLIAYRWTFCNSYILPNFDPERKYKKRHKNEATEYTRLYPNYMNVHVCSTYVNRTYFTHVNLKCRIMSLRCIYLTCSVRA